MGRRRPPKGMKMISFADPPERKPRAPGLKNGRGYQTYFWSKAAAAGVCPTSKEIC